MENQPVILVVDDSPDFLEIFSLKLKASGYHVETAQGGEEGFNKAKALKPNLVLLDMRMPGWDGAETLTQFKTDPETKGLKIVFLTSLGDPEPEMESVDARAAKDLGATGYLRKTDDLNDLVSKIAEYVSK